MVEEGGTILVVAREGIQVWAIWFQASLSW